MNNNSKILSGLHALRAIAAILVVACHFETIIHKAELLAPGYDKSQFAYMFFSRAGSIGVEIFFLISGFIMVHSTATLKNNEWWKFLIRRFFRIIPVYWFCLAIYWQFVTPETSTAKFIEAMFLLPNSNAGPPMFGLSLLGVAWTLTYEIVFYLYFALFIYLVPAKWKGRAYPLLILGITFAIQYALSGTITLNPQNAPAVSHDSYLARIIGVMANPLFSLFAIGAFFGNLYLQTQLPDDSRQWEATVKRISIATFIVALPACWLLPGVHGFYGVGIAAMLVFISAALQDHANLSGRSLIIKSLGDWSYGIYLTHEVFFEYVAIHNPSFWAEHQSPLDFLVATLTVIGISALLYQTIEKPAINIGHALCNRPI
jgi:peptidoglycan/LPS O-acetylase OafA/YrhL